MRVWTAALVAVAVAVAATASAQTKKAPVAPPPEPPPYKYDEAAARDINRVCAACHGEFGEGGGGGVYPRLAGLNQDYLAEQVRKFKSRQRENIPMIPFANERELSDRDVLDITRYLSGITLSTRPPAEDEPMDAHTRLMKMKQVVQIAREPGDAVAGKAVYDADCAACHGANGQGRVRKPPLALQHIRYLRTQVELFLAGKRPHDDIDELFRNKSPEHWNNLFAAISIMGRD